MMAALTAHACACSPMKHQQRYSSSITHTMDFCDERGKRFDHTCNHHNLWSKHQASKNTTSVRPSWGRCQCQPASTYHRSMHVSCCCVLGNPCGMSEGGNRWSHRPPTFPTGVLSLHWRAANLLPQLPQLPHNFISPRPPLVGPTPCRSPPPSQQLHARSR